MNSFGFKTVGGGPPVVLLIGAHCDDIEIGCGGTLLHIIDSNPDVEIRWLILSSNEARRGETLESARRFLGEDRLDQVRIENFQDGYLPYEGRAVKDLFESVAREISPDLIFTHYRSDLHQDHRIVNELTWNTWRNHTILEYEIPKYDGDLGQPNVFVALSPAQVDQKIRTVIESYSSQASKEWFDADTLRAMMRLRGVESNAEERYAEAFYARKMSIRI